MKINTLTVNNFGVFQGRHDFNLEPGALGDNRRSIIVFSGHNGTGKSTLFQALGLALYGSLALGTKVGQQEYNDYLLQRFHRHTTDAGLVISDTSSVWLSCSFVISGEPVKVQIERNWSRTGQSVSEVLLILENGSPPDVPPDDYQTWLSDIIPIGLDRVIFFDAEQLDALSGPEQHEALLEETLRRLLGLDLVERLQHDLNYYVRQQGGSRRIRELRENVIAHQRKLDAIESQLIELEESADELDEEERELRSELAHAERRLAAEGGTFAERRGILQDRLQYVEAEITQLSDRVREMCADLLPFVLVPDLSRKLSERLRKEAEIQRKKAAEELWQERVAQARDEVRRDDLWQDVGVQPDARAILTERLLDLLREKRPTYEVDVRLLHHLAPPEHDKLQSWVHLALNIVPQRAQDACAQLAQLKQERRQIDKDLRRAPDDELLAPIYKEINELESEIRVVEKRRAALNTEIGAVGFQRDEQRRERDKVADELQEAQSVDRQVDLAERSKLVLRTYQDALTRQRLNMLEKSIVKAFNAICRKEQLLSKVRIEPETFEVSLVGADGHVLGVGDLSAGERQLYVLALLQALREVSRRQLPLAIDTPLARLDGIHRQRLLSGYLPSVAQQVILFATDAELDDGLLRQIGTKLARIYRLSYSSEMQSTVVTSEDARAETGLISPNGLLDKVEMRSSSVS